MSVHYKYQMSTKASNGKEPLHKNCNAWEYTRTTHVRASGKGVNIEHAAQQGCVYQSSLKLTLRRHS